MIPILGIPIFLLAVILMALAMYWMNKQEGTVNKLIVFVLLMYTGLIALAISLELIRIQYF